MPELVTMSKGMYVAMRAVFSALLMLVMLVYVFAIILHSFLKDSDDRQISFLFSTIPKCMSTLVIDGIFLDNLGVVVRLFTEDNSEYVALMFFVLFVLVSAVTIMNMLIGVLCEVVCQVADAEKENAARAQVR